jgi:hypothetical protein
MFNYKRFSVSSILWLILMGISAHNACAQTAQKTIDNPQGGKIVYGPVDGATTQAEAMSKVLRIVHNNCGEKPQVGKVFKMRGTDSDAVFFTVVNHPQGNKQVAGLVIAAPSGPNQVEAALLSDDAARFGSTVNPMLDKLSSVWRPSGLAPAATASTGKSSASGPATGGHSAPAARLHTVTASDNSVSIGIPDGWTMEPVSGHGTIIVKGPRGELVALNMMRNAVDPTSQWQRNFWRQGGRPIPGSMIYPYHGNLAKAFPDMFQQWRRAGGQGPAKLQIDTIEQMPAPQGEECVHVKGHMDPDGRGMQTMNDMMCAIPPLNWGGYTVTLHHALLPNSLAEQEQATLVAMISSWKLNADVLNQQMAEAARQKAASDQAIMAQGQQAVANIHAIGQQATARYNATQAANDAQHAGYWAQQDSNARNGQAFSNYLLDQTVIQDNNMYGNGTIGHGTVWNSEADALVKANPNRWEIVNTPNYWQGVDY